MISCVIRNLVVVAALVVSLVPLVSRVERAYAQGAPSPARLERDRIAAELTRAAEPYRSADGSFALDARAITALAPIACRWALAVAALSSEERRVLRVRAGESYEPRAGVDGALVGAAGCLDPTERARVRHALGAPGWARELLDATATHRSAAAAFESALPPPDAALLAALRAAGGDLRRLEASRPPELARLVGELTGQECRLVPATLEALAIDGGTSASPPPRGFSVIVCEAPFVPDFAVSYGFGEPYCDNVSFPQVALLAHGSRGRHRVIAELAQNEGDSWEGFVSGEHITAIQSTSGAVLFEVETSSTDTTHHAEIVVCSPRTEACRWVHVATGDAAPAYTLTDTTLTVGQVTVTLRDWLAGTGASFGRADRAHDFPVPFRWAQREADGTRNTEAARCTFVVRDADGTLNVRAEPDQRSRVLGTIPTGSEIRAVWVTRSWLRIEQPFAGWIFRGATERRCTR